MRTADIFLAACIAAGFAFLCALGLWQVDRLQWKQALIERVEAGLSRAPVGVGDILSDIQARKDIEYRPMQASGVFLHDKEAHYFATHNGSSGYFVYTPLRGEDGSTLLVNRGFVPMDRKEPETRPEGQIEGVVTIQGLARSNQNAKPNMFVPNNDADANVYYWKNVNQMSWRGLDKLTDRIMPFFLDADATSGTGESGPIGGVTRITFPNSHLQYAITWFGLAAALLGVGGTFLWRRIRGRASP